jgi:hypothetical protein
VLSFGHSDSSLIRAHCHPDGERLMCGGFSLSETIHFGSLEFIADCFSGLSLSPKGSNSGAIFVGTTRSGSPSLWSMIENSADEFYMASSGGGALASPSPGGIARGHCLLPSQPHHGQKVLQPRRP